MLNILLAIVLFLLVIIEQVPFSNDIKIIDRIFNYLIINSILVILWVQIANLIYNKISYRRKKIIKIIKKNLISD